MTLTDKDAQRRIWCMFGDSMEKMYGPYRLIYVEERDEFPYVDFYGDRYKFCRECTPEELARRNLTQPPRPWADRVTQWAIDRNIIGGTTPKDQFGKLVEEVKELRDAMDEGDLPDIVDANGLVQAVAMECLSILGEIAEARTGKTLEDCLEAVYEVVSKRKGRMVDGVFVKETE